MPDHQPGKLRATTIEENCHNCLDYTRIETRFRRKAPVVAGLNAPGKGLVAVVVARKPGDSMTAYPYTTLHYAWNKEDRDQLVYAGRAV